MRVNALSVFLVLCLSLVCPAVVRGGDVSFVEDADQLRIQTPRWAMALDARSGAIRRIEDRSAQGTLLSGGAGLWTIERHGQPAVESASCEMRRHWDADKRRLTLDFDGPDAAVRMHCTAEEQGPAWQAEIRMKQGTMVGWRFPQAVQFDVAGLNQFVLPENLGLAFTRSFFTAGGAGSMRHTLGGKGLLQIGAEACQMRPVIDEPVAAKPDDDAGQWLPPWYLKEMPRWRVTANRCPAGREHLSLVSTEHGDWLSAYRLGGWGWFFRLGGMLGDSDRRPQIASVIATLSHVAWSPAADGTEVAVPADLAQKMPVNWPDPANRVGVVLTRPTGRPGVRRHPDPSGLISELARQTWFRGSHLEVAILQDTAEVRRAIAVPRQWFAIVNLVSEGFPAESPDQADSMLSAIREYVRNGGIWWEAGGGYPFHHVAVPQQDVHFSTANRDFCDFAAVDSALGRWSLLGIQKPDDLYVPARGEIAASGPPEARRGQYTHTFYAFARPGQTVCLPRQQMVLGMPHREALRQYGQENGFTRGLAEKASPELVEKLKRCILLKVTANNLKLSTRIARELPYPVLFHTADYLHGGFDKQYPDHLPPNPAVGTPEDFAELIRVCRERGHVFMPYTNPTWWCTNPKGETFETQGDAPLSRNLDGKVYPESYGLKTVQGYAVCAWHPAVREANAVTRRQFTQQYPVDVLFEDQVGARGPIWDTNPAAPHPGAYLEGIHRIARDDSALVPLGTEDGQDRLINWETLFCGLSWPWLPNRPSQAQVLYDDLWPLGSWRIEPLALFLAHDKVLFYHHDLGGFVRNRRDLAITLVMGYGLSWATYTADRSPEEDDWLKRLCRIQAAVGPRCAGRPLDEFEYLAPEVLRSRWGDLEIIANLSSRPWKVDEKTTIAPDGFLARAPDLTGFDGLDN
jgi:hypothetical protein